MQLHHVGYACKDIKQAISHLEQVYKIASVSPIIFDPLQDASLCLLELVDNSRIELVAGNVVESFLKNNIALYHVCYETPDLLTSLEQFKQNGNLPLSDPRPAILFGGRKVVFIQTELGLIELLEANTQNNSISVVVSGTFNLGPLLPYLEYLNKVMGLNFQFHFSAYNQVFQELLNPGSMLRQNIHGANFVFINLADWFQQAENFNSINDFLVGLAQLQQEHKICLCLCPIDYSMLDEARVNLITAAKQVLQAGVTNNKNITWLDMQTWLDIYNIHDHLDKITYQLGHIPYSEEFYAAMSLQTLKQLVTSYYPPFKLVVVDCDNTLWQGVIAEEGIAGIKLMRVICYCNRN